MNKGINNTIIIETELYKDNLVHKLIVEQGDNFDDEDYEDLGYGCELKIK